jgi:hypothetical protein
MKNIAIGILLIASMLFGGLYLRQIHKESQTEAIADGLLQKVDRLQSSLELQERQTTQLRDQLKEARADAATNNQEATHLIKSLQESLANQAPPATAKAPGQTNSMPSNPLSEMFKNPEMKEMIKSQQKSALGVMIDKNYAKIFSDLHLTPEQSSSLKDMILNKQLEAAQIGMSMLSDDMDATKRTELIQQIIATNDTTDAQIKEFLGDDNYAQFQSYEKSMGERMAVSGFKDQLGIGPAALTGDQEEQLIQAMTQERQNFKFTTDFSDQSKLTGDFASMFTEDKVNSYFLELGQLNQQYLTRAQGVLSQDQLTKFEGYLNSQKALQKAGMQMAGKMFSPAEPDGD